MHSSDPYELDQERLRRAFDRLAPDYEASAVLQARVREEMLERLELVRLAPNTVIDVGAATARAGSALAARYPQAQVLAVDFSPAMLAVARSRSPATGGFVCADMHRLPLRPASAELVFCNLALHYSNDPDALLAELARVLAPGGLLSLSTFGPDTLGELRYAWAQVDRATHVHRFLDMHDIGDALLRLGWAEPVLDVERYTLTYPDLRALMRDVRGFGAGNATAGRARGVTSRDRFAAVEAAYEAFREGGQLPASFEIVYAHAWSAAADTRERGEKGEMRVPVDRIGRRR